MFIAKDAKIPTTICVVDYESKILGSDGKESSNMYLSYYVSYKDEKGVIRSKNIKGDEEHYRELENKPVKGLMITDCYGGNYNRWNHFLTLSKEWIKITDKRGIVISISVQNLLFVLKHSSVINGVIEGEMIWAWVKGQPMLIPTNCEDYADIKAYSKELNKDKKFGAKDLVLGKKYLLKGNEEVYYIGRHQYYSTSNKQICGSGYKWNGWGGRLYETKKRSAHYCITVKTADRYLNGERSINTNGRIKVLTPSNVIKEFDETLTADQIKPFVDLIYINDYFNPIDYINIKAYEPYPLQDFKKNFKEIIEKLEECKCGKTFCCNHKYMFNMVKNDEGLTQSTLDIACLDREKGEYSVKVTIKTNRAEGDDLNMNRSYREKYLYFTQLNETIYFSEPFVDNIIEEIYNLVKPVIIVYTSDDGKNVYRKVK